SAEGRAAQSRDERGVLPPAADAAAPAVPRPPPGPLAANGPGAAHRVLGGNGRSRPGHAPPRRGHRPQPRPFPLTRPSMITDDRVHMSPESVRDHGLDAGGSVRAASTAG